MKRLLNLALALAIATGPAFAGDSMRPLPRPFNTAQSILADGSKVNHADLSDGGRYEVIERPDRSRQMTYTMPDGSRMVITQDANGQSSAVLFERNGHRRPLTPQGCDARLQGSPPATAPGIAR